MYGWIGFSMGVLGRSRTRFQRKQNIFFLLDVWMDGTLKEEGRREKVRKKGELLNDPS